MSEQEHEDLEGSGSFRFPTPPSVTYYDVLGTRRTFAGLGLLEWCFLIVSGSNIFVAVGLTLERLIRYSFIPNSPDFTYSLLLLISALFCAFYVFNGLLREHQYEIYAFVAAMLLVLCYCIFEYIFNVNGRNDIKLIRLIFGCVLAPINITLGLLVARQFGWLEFRIVGAAEGLLMMYRQLCFFLSLLKFDLQASISFLILVLQHGTNIGLEEILTLSIGLPLLIITFVIGFLAVQRELKGLLVVFVILSLIEPAYVIYKVLEVYLFKSFFLADSGPVIPYLLQYSMLCVGMLALLVRCILLFELHEAYKNYGYGLTERAFAGLVASETTSLLGRQRR